MCVFKEDHKSLIPSNRNLGFNISKTTSKAHLYSAQLGWRNKAWLNFIQCWTTVKCSYLIPFAARFTELQERLAGETGWKWPGKLFLQPHSSELNDVNDLSPFIPFICLLLPSSGRNTGLCCRLTVWGSTRTQWRRRYRTLIFCVF